MGVVIHRCLEGGIGFGDGGTFAAGHREVGILSIKRQMLARHAISRIEARWRVVRAYSHLMLKVIRFSRLGIKAR